MPSVVAEEPAVLWVVEIAMHLEGVGVVGEVDSSDRKAHCVFPVHIDVLGYAGVGSEVRREAWLFVGRKVHIVLQ